MKNKTPTYEEAKAAKEVLIAYLEDKLGKTESESIPFYECEANPQYAVVLISLIHLYEL